MLSCRRKEGNVACTGTSKPCCDKSSDPQLGKMMTCADSSDINGWEKCWEEGTTPWDLGQVTPLVANLIQSETVPIGRVLVPGCGAYIMALAGPDRYVVGLDISETGIKKAKEWSCSSLNKEYFAFLVGDFFNWKSEEAFDLIFDYTFFCAIDPSLRSDWAKRIDELLKLDGELITLIFVISGQEEGPPYDNNLADYEEVLNPLGFKAISIEDNELSVEQRKESEKLVRWKRCIT
ncbi:hypothetical protein LUZ60_001926 [Juncus effusus]|nr:hypothetical protein LUZ60_001926 [Juncus effusus]